MSVINKTYLESREILLHVSPAEQPHLVMRFVIVKFHRIRVGVDRLEEDTQPNQTEPLKTARPQNNNSRQSTLLLKRSLFDVQW